MSKNPVEKLSGLCLVTGASSGIGLELARLAAKDGCDLVLVADTDLGEAERATRSAGARSVEVLDVNLATREGIEALMALIGERQVDVLMANAGVGEGGAFLDQSWGEVAKVLHTNITGTVALLHRIGQRMRVHGSGRILVTGSVAGHMPGTFNLTYNSTKAFLDDFCVGLAEELRDSPVVVSCLLPGATETPFFERADLEDTRMGQSDKADPAKVAKDGYEALLEGRSQVTSGLMNKVQRVFADILPEELVAKMHRHLFKPGSGKSSAA